MTSPANSSTRDGKRVYTFRGEDYVSVTSVLKVIHSDALTGWAVKQVAERAVDMAEDLPALVKADRDGVLRTIKAARWVKTAAELGSLVHSCVDAYSKGEPMPTYTPEAAPYIRSFLMFTEDHSPEFKFNEATVYNRELGYAGTTDWIGTLDKKPGLAVGDWKTGKSIWPDVALQLSAYAHGEFIDQQGQEIPMPQVEEAYAVRLGKSEYELVPVKLSPEAWSSFRAALELTRWKQEHEKYALGAR
jgi:hypothetical protein